MSCKTKRDVTGERAASTSDEDARSALCPSGKVARFKSTVGHQVCRSCSGKQQKAQKKVHTASISLVNRSHVRNRPFGLVPPSTSKSKLTGYSRSLPSLSINRNYIRQMKDVTGPPDCRLSAKKWDLVQNFLRETRARRNS